MVDEKLADTQVISPDLIRDVEIALREGKGSVAIALTREFHAADIADLTEALPSELRDAFVSALGQDLDPEMLAELDEQVRDEVLDHLDPDVLASHVAGLDTDDAAEVLEDLDKEEQQRVLDALPPSDRELVAEALSYPESSAGRLMLRDYVPVSRSWNVGHVLDWLRDTHDLPEDFYELFVVDADH